MTQEVVRLADGRVVGEVALLDGVLTFRRRARGSRHQLRRPPAWALAVDVVERLAAAGVETVLVEDVEAGVTYTAPLRRLLEEGRLLDRGYGAQLALLLRYWARRDQRQFVLPFETGGAS